ncbi:MAG: hypothetical protein WD266_07005 [Balneolales bacterium]
MKSYNLQLPIVAKPELGGRGKGVKIIKTRQELQSYFLKMNHPVILQQYIEGSEFGVFYYRIPGEEKGRIFSITRKTKPSLTGNGEDSLGTLILSDEHIIGMASYHMKKNLERLAWIPAYKENVKLVELGSHCRGSIFFHDRDMYTPELEERMDQLSKRIPGFYFGRYDIITPSIVDFKAGHNFSILELNGVTAEAVHIYDPENSLFYAYKILFQQWQLAFYIGYLNAKKSYPQKTIRQTLNILRAMYKESGKIVEV